MFKAYVQACFDAGVGPNRITQTIGNAKASKGYHARDGYVTENGTKVAYCCAVDLRTRDLTTQQVHLLLERLAESGYAAWWRRGRLWRGNTHIHAIFVGHDMKTALRSQVNDWLNGRNGLKGGAKDRFVVPSERAKQKIRDMLAANDLQ